MSSADRSTLIDQHRKSLSVHIENSRQAWSELDAWFPDRANLGGFSSPMEQRVALERSYLHAVQETGRSMAVIIDARMVDELERQGLSPTPEQDYDRIAAETGRKFPDELARRKQLQIRRQEPGFASLPHDERQALLDELTKLNTGVAGRRFMNARLAWLDADARREMVRRQVVRDEVSSAVACGGVPLAASLHETDLDPSQAASRYGWQHQAPPEFSENIEKCWQTYPDALLARAVDRMGPLEIHYASAARARMSPDDLLRGAVSDAVTMHYPASTMDGLEGLIADTERIRQGTPPTALVEVPVSSAGIDSMFRDRSGNPVDVGALAFDDDDSARAVLEQYAAAVNAAGGIPGPSGTRKALQVRQVPRSTSMNTAAGLVLTTSDPEPSADPDTLRGVGPVMLTSGDEAPTLHELGHYVEAGNPHIYVACKRFRDDRCAGFERTEHVPGVGALCSADFADPYVSAVYEKGRTTEVFTTGMEALFTGKYGALSGEHGSHDLAFDSPGPRADSGHRDLVLGLLLASDMPYE